MSQQLENLCEIWESLKDKATYLERILWNIPPFDRYFLGMQSFDRREVCKNFQLQCYDQGQVIYYKNEPSQSFYIIAKGLVTLYDQNEGELVEVKQCYPTEGIGSRSALRSLPRNFTAAAAECSVLLELSSNIYRKYLGQQARAAMNQLMEFISRFFPYGEEYTQQQREKIANYIEYQQLNRKAVVISKNTPNDCLYFVYSGKLSVTADFPSGITSSLVELNRGSIFGEEYALFGELCQYNTIVISEKAEVYKIRKTNIQVIPNKTVKRWRQQYKVKYNRRSQLTRFTLSRIGQNSISTPDYNFKLASSKAKINLKKIQNREAISNQTSPRYTPVNGKQISEILNQFNPFNKLKILRKAKSKSPRGIIIQQMSNSIKLIFSNGESVEFPQEFIHMSDMIRQLLQNTEHPDEIPLEIGDSDLLSLIKQYCDIHNYRAPTDYPQTLTQSTLAEAIKNNQDYNFITSIGFTDLIRIIELADYLDMKHLLSLGCVCLAQHFKEKDLDTIKSEFEINDEITIDEEEQIRRENPWIYDWLSN